jgi:DNA ligase-associated metallophosphoesterase
LIAFRFHPMQGSIETEFGGETLTLLAQRGVWWPRERTLFIADTHFGKTAAFRHAGLAVPETVTGADVDLLDGLLRRLGAQRLVILGDFFHAPSGRVPVTEGRIEAWRRSCPEVHVVLVRGNHDRGAGDPPQSWGFECVDPCGANARVGAFALVHTPEEAAGVDGPALCGHVHPGVVMRAAESEGARLRCFHFSDDVLTIPAFGRFTGMGIVRPRRGDGVFVIAGDEVVDVSPPGTARGREKTVGATSRGARYDGGMKTEAKTG